MTLTFRADPKRAKLLPLQVDAPDIEEWLLARDPQASGSWRDIGREEYARAFTAAQTAGYDVIDDLYYGLVDAIARRSGSEGFEKEVVPILKAKGWLGGDDGAIASRVRLIFDTNLTQARRSGQWQAYQQGKFATPYLRAFTVGDERVRHPPHSKADHRAWDGIVLPIDHPFWQEYGPGHFAFRCRCDSAPITRSQLARMEGGVTSEAELAERKARIGPPVFASPAMPIDNQLATMVAASNDEDRMPGRPTVDARETARRGGDEFDAVMRASSLRDIGRQLAAMGL